MIIDSYNLQTVITNLKNIADLEQLDKEAHTSLDKNFSLLRHRQDAVDKLELLAVAVQDTLEELAALPSFLSIAPSWNEKILSTINLAYDAQDMTIYAIAQLCYKKLEKPTPLAQKRSFQERLHRIAQTHLQTSPHHNPLLSRAMMHVQGLENDESLDWELIDRLMHAFVTIVQAQKHYYHPESKKNR